MSDPGAERRRSDSPLDVDSLSMWQVTAGLPEQVADALETGRSIDGLPDGDDVDTVVVLGLGGSGIAGDVLAAAAAGTSRVPVSVVKSYELPSFVGPRSLVFAVSCSGNTEETLTTAEAAWTVGAKLVVVAGGGELARLAGEHGAPIVGVPSSIPQPRAAIGATAVPLLVIARTPGPIARRHRADRRRGRPVDPPTRPAHQRSQSGVSRSPGKSVAPSRLCTGPKG